MHRQELESAFLDAVYQAAAFPEQWPEAVRLYGLLLDAPIAHLHIVDIPTGEVRHSVQHGMDQELIRLGNERYFHIDPFVSGGRDYVVAGLKRGVSEFVLTADDVIHQTAYLETEYYRDFTRKWGVVDMAATTSVIGGAALVNLVANQMDGRRFRPEDKNLLKSLRPHVNRAVQLSCSLGLAASERSVAHLWASSKNPVFLLQLGRLTYCNSCGAQALSSARVVARSRKSIRFADSAANSALEDLENETLSARRHLRPTLHRTVIAEDATGESWLVQMVRLKQPPPAATPFFLSVDPGLFVMLSPLNALSAARAGAINGFVQFSNHEKTILSLLVDGHSVQRIASRTDRSVATVRWHIRSMLAKARMRTLADLIRLAALAMPF